MTSTSLVEGSGQRSSERYRILALDFGTKRVGVAISDELRMLASARGVLENGPMLIREIVAMATKENVRIVLLGIPRSLRNDDSAMTTEVRRFGSVLAEKLRDAGVTLEYRDERLTSVMANFNIAQSGLPKKKREVKSLRDEEAARIVLQEYLDTH